MKFCLLIALAFIALLQLVRADIYCNDQGICSGGGRPSEDVRCGGCHSCTYKNCCHVRFTNPQLYRQSEY